MPSASFAGGAVRVRTPGSYDAHESHDRGDRDLGDGSGRTAAKSALLAALAEQDFDVVDRIDLTPRRSRDLDSPAPGEPPCHGGARCRRRAGRRRGRAARARRGLLVAPARAPHRGDAVAGAPHRVLRDRRPASETGGHPRPRSGRTTARPARRAAPRPWAARRPRARRGAGDRPALRRAGRRGSCRAQARGARAAGTRPRRRSCSRIVAARGDRRPAGAADRPASARPPPRARHLLVDGRCLRPDGARAGSRGIPPDGVVGLRRRHRLRPPHPQRRTLGRMPTTCWPSCGASIQAPT